MKVRKQHFELTPSSTLATAQASLASELAPAITTLLQRSEQYLAKLERKQNNLVARSELLEGRLEGKGGLRKQRSLERLVRRAGTPRGGSGEGKEGEERALKLKALRQKKERLGYAVERLTLQSQQRQRQLRMSVAAT
jgi:DASH complex subunit SPC19